ncbi:MAG: homoserine kinase [Bacteroidota bacterium]|nr:homoserine kinase [Bacteroidota bacterium]
MKIKVPASTSNLGPGFDTLGLALDRYLELSVEVVDTKNSPEIIVKGNGVEHIAADKTNLVYQGMVAVAKHAGTELPSLRLSLNNGIPSCGGLGGSGAAISGGVFLANEILDVKLSREEMLNIAVGLEGHPDNVSAALMGGLTINCFDNGSVRCRSVKIAAPLSVVACSPRFQVLTKEARKILPKEVLMKDAVRNIENVASLVASLIQGDVDALRYATSDTLHEQYRASLIPGFDDVKKAALDAGALSFNISGAGPTVFCFAVSNEKEIGSAMVKAFAAHGREASCEMMRVENEGARAITK